MKKWRFQLDLFIKMIHLDYMQQYKLFTYFLDIYNKLVWGQFYEHKRVHHFGWAMWPVKFREIIAVLNERHYAAITFFSVIYIHYLYI